MAAGELRVRCTIPQLPHVAEYLLAAAVHLLVWGGGMVVGPLLLVTVPLWFLLLPSRYALVAASVIGLLTKIRLPESPLFNRIFLRTASLLRGGSTVWFADAVLPHVGDGVMVCFHPHGVIPLGYSLNGAVRAKTRQPEKFLPKEATIHHTVSGVQAPVLFRIPLLRQAMHLFGCTMPATKAGMFSLFKRKVTFGIIVGGSEEVALQVSGRERLFLRHRAGFIKYALQFGYKIIVAYTFGESDLYQNVTWVRRLNMWLVKNLGFVLPIFYGKWWCPLLPRDDVPLNTVYGSVLELPRIDSPTGEQVRDWHAKYVAAVTEVFEAHKARFGYADRKLEIL